MNYRKIAFILAGGLAMLGIAWLGFTLLRPHTFHGQVIQSPDVAPDFTLTSTNGQPVSLSDFRGRLVVLYFGYTFCPDVCPATLSEIKQALEILGSQADQVQVIMITVDPERDTPEKLGQYLAHFSPSFLGLTGTPEEISTVATLYGIYYAKEAGSEATDYLVNHTASQMVIDTSGHLKLIFAYGTPAEDIADDLRFLLR
jgi:protein SCO1/2